MTITTDEPYGLPAIAGPWHRDMDELASEHGEKLSALLGRRLTRAWVIWDRVKDRWFPDGPVVLDFEGERLELAANDADEVSLAWNTIDVARPIGWSDEVLDLVWREDGLDAFARHRGARVLDARVARDPNGIAFTLETGELRVFNAVDEAGVRDARRRSRLAAMFDQAARAIHDRREPLLRWSTALLFALLVWRLLVAHAPQPPF